MSFRLEGVAVGLAELGSEPEGEEAVFPPSYLTSWVRGAVPGFTAYGPNVPTGANGISDSCKLSDSLVLGSKPCNPAGGSEVGTDQHSGPGSSSIGQPPSFQGFILPPTPRHSSPHLTQPE